MRKLSHQELLERQDEIRGMDSVPLVIVVNNVRSLYNVGSIFRTSDGVGIEKLWLCGITGIPPAPKISKIALDAEKTVPWEYAEDAKEVVLQYRELGYEIVMLEQTSQSISYREYEPDKPVCLILGNEVEGVEDSLLEITDRSIEIEMAGLKNSLNVTIAFGVVAYEIRHQLKKLVKS